jgi:hypothetical protein
MMKINMILFEEDEEESPPKPETLAQAPVVVSAV